MKTVVALILALAIIVVVGLVFVPGLWQHAKQVPKDAAAVVDNAASDSHTEGIVVSGFVASENALREQYTNLYRTQLEVAKIEADERSKQEQTAKEEQILKRAQGLLEKNKPGATISIGGTAYSWEQVNEDALQRLNTCKVLRQAIQADEQSLAKLRKAHADGIEVIRKGREELRRKRMDFEADKAELAALRAQEQVADLVAKIQPGADAQTELGRAKKIFDDRLNLLKAKAEYDRDAALGGGAVSTWGTELGINQKKAAEGIKDYFEGKEKKADRGKPPDVGKALESLTTGTK